MSTAAVAHDDDAAPIATGLERSAERLLEGLRRDFGRECMDALEDPTIVELMLNPDGNVWVDQHGKGMYELGLKIAPSRAMKIFTTFASLRDTTITRKNPILEDTLPFAEARFEGLIAPVVRAPTFAIRKPATRIMGLQEYHDSGVLSHRDDPANRRQNREANFAKVVAGMNHMDVLQKAIEYRKNILVVGSTGSGKTTLVNAILGGISELTPADRIVLIEDTGEVQCASKNNVKLRSTVHVTMEMLLRATMRLAPKRICVGEVRGAEALSLLESWNTGHPGGLATVHANDAADGLSRILTLCRKGAPAISGHFVAQAVDVVIFIDKDAGISAGRKVREVAVVDDFDEGRQAFNVTRV